MDATALNCQKAEFGLPDSVHYLNCAYMGPLPLAAEAAGNRGLGRKRNPADIHPPDFFTDSDRLRALFAQVTGAPDPGRVAIHPAVSYAIATAARNFKPSKGDRIVVLESQFPANIYPWRRLAQATGATLHTVPRPAGSVVGKTWNERLVEAIDARTRVVAMPQVHWTDGTLFDLAAVGQRARDCGAGLIIDATQSAGMMQLDFERVQPDLYTAAAYKWLLGPYSVALTWLGPRFDDGVPLEETWLGREGSDDFQALVDYEDRYRAGAARYDVGERSNFALLPAAIAAHELMCRWSPERLSDYVSKLLAPLAEKARELGFGVEDDTWRCDHMVGLRMPEAVDLSAAADALSLAGVVVSLRGSFLRVSPHIYNSADDIEALIETLVSLRR